MVAWENATAISILSPAAQRITRLSRKCSNLYLHFDGVGCEGLDLLPDDIHSKAMIPKVWPGEEGIVFRSAIFVADTLNMTEN
jgi:hypothetical protein